MDCPKCGFAHLAPVAECARCGVIVTKFLRLQALAAAAPAQRPAFELARPDAPDVEGECTETRAEVYVRAIAVPAAVVCATGVASVLPFPSRLIAMWVHEAGHAVAAWFSGYLAFPGPWMTPVGSERTLMVPLMLVGGLAAGLYVAARRARWFWVVASALGLVFACWASWVLGHDEAQQLIVFGGDGGAFVLGGALMMTMYARKTSPIRREGLRWALLVIGAIAFADARGHWSGNPADILFGEDDRGLSDPSVLIEHYNWSLSLLMGRYALLSSSCVALMGAGYLAGLLQAMRRVPDPAAAADVTPAP